MTLSDQAAVPLLGPPTTTERLHAYDLEDFGRLESSRQNKDIQPELFRFMDYMKTAPSSLKIPISRTLHQRRLPASFGLGVSHFLDGVVEHRNDDRPIYLPGVEFDAIRHHVMQQHLKAL